MFDLFNEPYPDNNQSTTDAWTCWKNGGACANVDYETAGMQELVSAVRATGSTNVIVLSGIQYAGNTSQVNVYKPTDPLNQSPVALTTTTRRVPASRVHAGTR